MKSYSATGKWQIYLYDSLLLPINLVCNSANKLVNALSDRVSHSFSLLRMRVRGSNVSLEYTCVTLTIIIGHIDNRKLPP